MKSKKRKAKKIKKEVNKVKMALCLLVEAIVILTLVVIIGWNKGVGDWMESLQRPVVRKLEMSGINSPYAVLMQVKGGKIIGNMKGDEKIYPASMTKMMTALLAIEANPDLDTPVTLPEEIFPALQAQNASLAGFQAGETATVRDLLYGAMLPSGAECCEAPHRPARPGTCFHRAGYGPADRSGPAERDLPQAVYHGAVYRSGHQLPPAGVHDAQHPAEPAGRHRAAPWPDPGR